MRPGALPDKVTIQQLTSGYDDYGHPVEVWQDVCTVPARVEDLSGREYLAAQQVPTVAVTTRITVRHRDDISEAMRVLHRGRVFNIRTVQRRDTRKIDLELMCEEVK